ncbi:MAG: DUF4012 domain-containing protein [Parcubacteria group bacterium]|nr:DUF4012 domain-containing protein [Parcubacteria group bacterium]
MPRVPKINVSGILQDIKHPSVTPRIERVYNVSRRKVPALLDLSDSLREELRPRRARRKFWVKLAAASALFIFTVAAFFAVNLLHLKDNFLASADTIKGYMTQAKISLLNFNPRGAKESFVRAGEELDKVKNDASRYKLTELSSVLGTLVPALKQIPEIFSDISSFNDSALKISDVSDRLMREGARYAFSGRGDKLIADLQDLQVDVRSAKDAMSRIRNKASLFANFSDSQGLQELIGEDYIGLNLEFSRIDEFISGLLGVTSSPTDRHIAIFFQNPSEMRPSGGFIGSYADMVIRRGNIVSMDVRDIYDPDGQLDLKVVPPFQLQTLTKRWGARDANWFFDFPTSAEKVLSFVEQSKIYQEKLVTFEGVIALNADVIGDILSIVGPIELPEYKLTIDDSNFLKEIQKEVEAGRDKKVSQPKRILKTLTPLLLKSVMNLDENQQRLLLAKLQERSVHKDIQVYWRDSRIENFIVNSGMGGEVFRIPQGFFGDYLAVVNSNVAGGKTDIFMKQKIALTSSLDADGETHNHLAVTRTHSGQNQLYSWYRATNQDYMRIFTAPNSRPTFVKGNSKKTIYPLVDYKNAGYSVDRELALVESTMKSFENTGVDMTEEAGKTVFGTWFNVAAGASSTLEFDYERDGIAASDGKSYQFVFEKQSGVKTSFDLTVNAPLGYKWQEANGEVFSYHAEDPEARIMINLTPVKL